MGSYENDRAFEAVLQNTGQNIEQFIDEFFSFLARRSDFFVVSPVEGGRIGFPPGVAAKLVISKYKKWETYVNREKRPDSNVQQALTKEGEEKEEDVYLLDEVSHTVEVPYSDDPVNVKTDKSNDVAKEECTTASASELGNQKTESKPISQNEGKKKTEPIGLCDTYNGRNTDKYSWSQSINELDIYIKVGKDVQTKKQVKVEIHMNKIRIVTKIGSENDEVMDWQLSHPIVKDESYWSLHPGESIFLSLQKVREMWWDHLFEGEEPIDRSKIEAVRPMEDLGDEEHAKIEELVWNQDQKLKGLPTSEEKKMEEIMKKAWDAEGSPFKGQPFDMSRIQLASDNGNVSPSS